MGFSYWAEFVLSIQAIYIVWYFILSRSTFSLYGDIGCGQKFLLPTTDHFLVTPVARMFASVALGARRISLVARIADATIRNAKSGNIKISRRSPQRLSFDRDSMNYQTLFVIAWIKKNHNFGLNWEAYDQEKAQNLSSLTLSRQVARKQGYQQPFENSTIFFHSKRKNSDMEIFLNNGKLKLWKIKECKNATKGFLIWIILQKKILLKTHLPRENLRSAFYIYIYIYVCLCACVLWALRHYCSSSEL